MNNFVRLKWLGLILIWACQACSEGNLTPKEYVNYVKDPKNGLVKRCTTDAGVYMEAFYQPPVYTALLQLKNTILTDKALSEQINKNSGFHHILFSIGSAGSQPINETLMTLSENKMPLSEKNHHIQYNAQSSFYLLSNRDSIPCTFYHVQSTGSIDNQYHMILAFENGGSHLDKNLDDHLTLVFDDTFWFDQKFAFEFDQNKLQQSPKLKI